jgi:hypothetical protein
MLTEFLKVEMWVRVDLESTFWGPQERVLGSYQPPSETGLVPHWAQELGSWQIWEDPVWSKWPGDTGPRLARALAWGHIWWVTQELASLRPFLFFLWILLG